MTTEPHAQDSSAIFSLHELLELEEKRLADEASERQRRQDDRRRAEEDRIRRQREAEQAEILRAQQQAEEKARRQREEDARLAAMREAILADQKAEKARQAQAQEEAQRLDHERRLAQINADSAARRMRRALIGVSLGAAALIAGSFGLYFGKIKPDADQRAALAASDATEQRAIALKAQHDADEARQKLEELNIELQKARNPVERAQVQERINTVTRTLAPQRTQPLATGKSGPDTAAPPCEKGDPMCGLRHLSYVDKTARISTDRDLVGRLFRGKTRAVHDACQATRRAFSSQHAIRDQDHRQLSD
jgi:membrane protein involved in colicin uptake